MTVLEITTYGRNTLRRLRREARIVDPSLVPGLAPAYEIDRLSPTPVLVTEDLPDITLDDLVSMSPLPAAAALHALQDVAATLEAMHANGVVHGDLRPSTVFILPDGRAALARPDTAPPVTEEALGAARLVDAHAFAILAFELLTGVHPLAPPDAVAMTSSLPVLPRSAATVLELALTLDGGRRPLPHAVMAALDAIPPEEWPTNHLRRPPRPLAPPIAVPSLRVQTIPRPKPEPPEQQEQPEPPVPATVVETPSRSLFRRVLGPLVITLGLLTVAAGGGAGAWLLFTPDASADDPAAAPPLQVRRVALSVTPPQAHCPRAALRLTATVVADGGPGRLELEWRLPDGSTADPHSFLVDGGRTRLRAALDVTLTGTNQLRGKVVAVVVGHDGARATAPIRYLCRREDGAPRQARRA
ncbi:hypothetical protein D0Z08_04575 [Nocardioides immobilis]|uniref:Protein kinase domain-containing protein n=1 Tax=Nocardioides immobilis TaxID=2049295 RepID=A0A417Y6W9_9ACTN|nr:hypothetical protein [Nocardioides immobilis]RHW28261.1 hypothetical protein D0Z08_04575 [Nocardioides immobilis]